MTRLHKREVEAMVESKGLKMTPQRRAIVEYLQYATHHPTADEVFTAVNEKFPMTSRATVYNTLNWLKRADLVREVFVGGVIHFDPNTSNHHHFICRHCGQVDDVVADGSFHLDQMLKNHRIENFEITLRGTCPDCQSKWS